jgi:hypothetical protein
MPLEMRAGISSDVARQVQYWFSQITVIWSLYVVATSECPDIFGNINRIAMCEPQMRFRMRPYHVEHQHVRVGPELPADGIEWRRLRDFVALA